ncbi:LysR family transcriptional regulator [Nonomuraea purpurea]|uniref:LysR family transcriptional regulator n=1 Tax=Nonomuraea purpurea TaxID=1849276 RepID=A0ABV8G159_9ACTN
MLEVWSLRVLVEVGRLGSFSAAAQELSMTQPAVSRQIAALERHTGVRLFERLPRGVRPTDAGTAALEQAGEVLRGMRLFETRLRAFATASAGRVRVSAFPSAATRYLPERFRAFTARHPAVELSLRVWSGEHDPCAAVLDGEVDVALLTSWDVAGAGAVTLTPLCEDELFVALPAGHHLAGENRTAERDRAAEGNSPAGEDPVTDDALGPMAGGHSVAGEDQAAQRNPGAGKDPEVVRDRPVGGDRVRLRDLAGDPWIDGTHPDCLGPISALTGALGGPPRISHVCDDWTGRQGLVAAGVGVMLYPSIAGVSTVRPDIRLLRPSPPLPPRRILAATFPADSRPPAVSAFLTFLTPPAT